MAESILKVVLIGDSGRADRGLRVRHQDHPRRRPAAQGADLGHGRPGALPVAHGRLLPQRRGRHDRVRHHEPQLVRARHGLAGAGARALAREPRAHPRGQQVRPGPPAGEQRGVHARGGKVRSQALDGVLGDVRTRLNQRRRRLQEAHRSGGAPAVPHRAQEDRATTDRLETRAVKDEAGRVLVREPVHQGADLVRAQRARQAVPTELPSACQWVQERIPKCRHGNTRELAEAASEGVPRTEPDPAVRGLHIQLHHNVVIEQTMDGLPPGHQAAGNPSFSLHQANSTTVRNSRNNEDEGYRVE
ncbi:hypothetical protein ON010_g12947 [Phytophthora cinnamomi]|nr:hypothetical protein ON010_g12947 [Phytophthora cinnamomi]